MRFWQSVAFAFAFPPAAFAQEKLERFEYEEPHMGSLFRLTLYAPSQETADKAAKAAFARVERLNDLLSDYKADSELMVLCRKFEREIGPSIAVSDELFTVLIKAREVSELSEGAFDVTVGPVVKLWRQARKTKQVPPAAELAAALKKVGWRNVELDPAKKTVKLLVPGMQLDLGGIAKGYAADEALDALQTFGITRAMFAASGDISCRGAPPDSPGWKIRIGKLTRASPDRVLILKDQSVSTSGDAEQFVEIGGRRYSHIVDPRTGLGLPGKRSVSVVAPKGILADSLTKMASVHTPEKAVAEIEKLPGVQCLIAIVKGEEDEQSYRSAGFDALLSAGKD